MGDIGYRVAFTVIRQRREPVLWRVWLINAQEEGVVAGIRTPSPLNDDTKNEQNKHLKSMQEIMRNLQELVEIRHILEFIPRMLDIEFTIRRVNSICCSVMQEKEPYNST